MQPLGEEEMTVRACVPAIQTLNGVYVKEVHVGVVTTVGGLHVVVPAMQPLVQVEGQTGVTEVVF